MKQFWIFTSLFLAVFFGQAIAQVCGGGGGGVGGVSCSVTATGAGSGGTLVKADVQNSDGVRVFNAGATVNILYNTAAASADTLNWSIRDALGNLTKSGSFGVATGNVQTTLACTGLPGGYFSASATLANEGGALPVVGTRPPGIATFGVIPSTGLPAVTYAQPDEHRIGMQGFNHNYPALVDLGIKWVLDGRRQCDLEPSAPNTYNVSNDLDPFFTSHPDIQRMVRLDCIPAWNSTRNASDDYGFPTNTTEYQSFMAKIGTDTANIHTSTYPSLVHNYYQATWEPSLQMVYPSASFVPMYQLIYNGIHSTDPNAVVMGVGNPFPNNNNNATGTWIAQYQPTGFCNNIDGVTTHNYYNAGTYPAHPPELQNQVAGTEANSLNNEMAALRSTMQSCKPNMILWATEGGIQYDPGIAYGSSAISTNQLWAQGMVVARTHIITLGEGAQVTFPFFGPDYPGEIGYGTFFALDNANGNLGSTDLSPKPAAMAIAAMSRALDGTDTLGKINNMPATGYGYAFQKFNSGPVISALWAHDNGHWPTGGLYSTSYSVPYSLTVDNVGTSGNVTILDVFGNPTTLAYTNGAVGVNLTESPIYVVSHNATATLTHVTAPVGYTGQFQGALANPNTVVVNGVTWTLCATEHSQTNATCNFTGTQNVLYGAFPPNDSTPSYGIHGPFTSNVLCDNTTLGPDPAPGFTKACYTNGTQQSNTFTPPTLVNPQNPMNFGALCNGTHDDTAAFQSAVNAGDVLVPAGVRTCLINGTINVSVSNKHIQCDANGGTTLKRTTGTAFNMFLIGSSNYNNGVHYVNDSIVYCHFFGANTQAPSFTLGTLQFDIPVETYGMVDNFFLAGNDFKQFYGQSMFQTYSTGNAGSGDIIEYNTFESCGYYGPVFDAHTNGYIGHNQMTDCAAGVENDNTGQNTGHNIIEFNTSTAIWGYGAPDMGASVMLTGGVAGGAQYGTNIVRNNTVSGQSNGLGAHGVQASELITGVGWTNTFPAQYSGNTCNSPCVVTPHY